MEKREKKYRLFEVAMKADSVRDGHVPSEKALIPGINMDDVLGRFCMHIETIKQSVFSETDNEAIIWQ
jgi:hypothetical protein